MKNTQNMRTSLSPGHPHNIIRIDKPSKTVLKKEDFLTTLFERCQQGYIEFRPVPLEGDRQWLPLNTTVPPLPDKNIYIGVATRENGGGKKIDIVEIPAVWVDIDFKDTPEEDADEKIKHFPLEPSIKVNSGGGYHLYWVLRTPATQSDIQKIEDINKRLATELGGDQGSTDAAHILRLPGTRNHKYDPPRPVRLVTANGNLYDLSDFNFLPPVASNVMPIPVQHNTSSILNGVSEGERHTKAVSLAGRYLNHGLDISETRTILTDWNSRNTPPLETKEISDTVIDVYQRYPHTVGGTTTPGYSFSADDYETIIENAVMESKKFVAKQVPAKSFIIYPWLKRGEIIMISAPRGVGKTWFALLISKLATRNMELGPWKNGEATGCLYIDGEMAAEEMQDRLSRLDKACPAGGAPLQILSSDTLRSEGKPAPNFTKASCRDGLLQYLRKNRDINLLIIDNLACTTPGLDENNKKDWDPINQWLLELRSIDVAVIMIHHTGKSGLPRGTSSREDMLNVMIDLKNPVGYSHKDGARFTVSFTKGRRLYGDIMEPFTLSLKDIETEISWTVESGGPTKEEIIINLLRKGGKNKDIAKEVSCKPSYISQVKKKAMKEGLLPASRKTDQPLDETEIN